MLNYINLVGRLVRKPKLAKTDSGKTITTVTLAVPRSFKNMDGIYDTDFIDCTCWDSVAINTHEYCNVGDVLCIKGRLSSRLVAEEDFNKKKLEVIAEKITFLTTRKKEETEEEVDE